jgi:hypothetical protein
LESGETRSKEEVRNENLEVVVAVGEEKRREQKRREEKTISNLLVISPLCRRLSPPLDLLCL